MTTGKDDFVVGLSVDATKVIASLDAAIKKAAVLEAQVRQAQAQLSAIAQLGLGAVAPQDMSRVISEVLRSSRNLSKAQDTAAAAVLRDLPTGASPRQRNASGQFTSQAQQVNFGGPALANLTAEINKLKEVIKNTTAQHGIAAMDRGRTPSSGGRSADTGAGRQHVAQAGNDISEATIKRRNDRQARAIAENNAFTAKRGFTSAESNDVLWTQRAIEEAKERKRQEALGARMAASINNGMGSQEAKKRAFQYNEMMNSYAPANNAARERIAANFIKENANRNRGLDPSSLARMRYDSGAQNFRQSMERFNPANQPAKDPNGPGESRVENVFRRALLFGAVSAGIFKAVQAGGMFIKTMIDMDKQMTDLRKTLGGTDDDFRKLVDSAINIARTYKGSVGEVLDAIEIFSAQFKSAVDLESLSKSAVLFANIAGVTLKESAQTLTSVIEQYHLSVSQAAGVTDSWANVAANSAVSVKDLGDAFGVSGAAAKNAGVSIDQLNGMVAAVAAATGKSGAAIGNAFTRIFERSTSQDNAVALYKMGISVKDLAGNFRPFGDVLSDLDGKWNHLSATQQKQIAILFAGARQYSVFMALMDNFKSMTDATTRSQDSLGAAQRQNLLIGDTFVKKIQMLGVEYDALARTTGDHLIPAMGGLVDVMTKLLNIFNEMPGGIKSVGLAIAAITGTNLAGSALFKFVNTKYDNGKLVMREGAHDLGLGAGALDAETGSVSLIAGIGNKTLKGGGMLGRASNALELGAFGAGLLTVTAALVALAAVAALLYEAWDKLRSKTMDSVRDINNINVTASQKIRDNTEIRSRIKDIREEIKSTSSDTTITDQEKRKRLTDLRDVQLSAALRDLSSKNPDLVNKQGLVFDSLGRVVNATESSLDKLVIAINDASDRISMDAKKRAGEKIGIGVGEIDKDTSPMALRNRVKGMFSLPVSLGGSGDLSEMFLDQDPNGAHKKAAKFLFGVSNKLEKSGLSIDGLGTDKESIDELSKRGVFSGTGVDFIPGRGAEKYAITQLKEYSQLKNAIKDTYGVEALSAGQSARDSFLSQRKNPSRAVRDQADKIGEKIAHEFLSKKIEQDHPGLNLNERALLASDILMPQRGSSTRGPAVSGKGPRALLGDFSTPRIDFELNKSLTANSRSFELFGGDVKLAENALTAYKTALTDMANTPEKAAGPQEEIGMELRKLQIDDLKVKKATELKNVKAENLNDPAFRKAIGIEQQILELEAKQGIENKNLNEERSAGVAILKDMVDTLQNIVDLQQMVRGPLTSALAGIPQNMANITLADRKNSQVTDVENAQNAGRIQELYNRDITAINRAQYLAGPAANVANFDLQRRNANVTRQNSIANLNWQKQQSDEALAANSRANNPLTNALNGIGGNFVGKLSSNAVNGLMESLASSVPNIMGMNLFGQNNPQVDALNQNTDAIKMLTMALGGTAAAAGIGSIAAGGGLAGAANKLASLDTSGLGAGGFGAGVGGAAVLGLGGTALGIGMNGTNPGDDLGLNSLDTSLGGFTSKSALLQDQKGFLASTSDSLVQSFKKNGGAGAMILGGLAGAGAGNAITNAQGKQGYGGSIGGLIGGGFGTAVGGPIGGAIGGILGGVLGSFFDKPIEFHAKPLDQLPEVADQIVYELQKIDKRLNTINETMSNIINAPSTFTLPIPQGILNNSVTAQSAIATPLQAGGLIIGSGPAFLHKGDVVNGVSSRAGSTTIANHVTVNGANQSPDEIANAVINKINSNMYKEAQRDGSYKRRF